MAALSGLIGTICTFNLTSAELNILGNFLQAIGQTIAVAQAQAAILEQQNTLSKYDFMNYKKELDYKINYLYQILNLKIK